MSPRLGLGLGQSFEQRLFTAGQPGSVQGGAGAASLSLSLITCNQTVRAVGATATVMLTAYDAGNNRITTGGETVAFACTGGTFGATTDVGDGTYTATFTAVTAAFAAANITGTIGGAAVTSAKPTMRVYTTPGLTSLTPSTGPGGTSVAGVGTNLDPSTTFTADGSAMTSVNVTSATTFTAVTPAHANGAVNIVATTGALTSNTLTGGFTYQAFVAPDLFLQSLDTDATGLTNGGSKLPTDPTAYGNGRYWALDASTYAGASGKSIQVTYPRTSFPIVSNSVANPTVVYSPGHAINTGDYVEVSGVVGSTPSINGGGKGPATKIDADHYSLPINVTQGGTGGWGGKNTGNPFFRVLSVGQKVLYAGFYYRQDVGFNDDGVNVNSAVVKMVRFLASGYGSQYLSMVTGGSNGYGIPKIGWDYWNGAIGRGQNQGGPTFSFNDALETWYWVEMMGDITAPSAARFKLWINSTLTHDYTLDLSPGASGVTNGGITGSETFGVIQFDGTVNEVRNATTKNWYDRIAISTQRIGP